jgi:hypothetical protein
MRSGRRVWIAALCLLSATVVTVSLKARLASVHAATIGATIAPAPVSHAMSAASVGRLSNAALRATAVRNSMLLDDDGFPLHVNANVKTNTTILPQVEEFTLTPPATAQGITKTTLEVRFPAAQAAGLASSIPVMLGKQSVALQRSPGNPNTFVTSVDFDWHAFEQEQAQRKIAASQGRTVSIFDGRRFVRTEQLQFVEPSQIEQTLETHQPIQFSSGVLQGSSTVNVFPDHELMMNSTEVVNAPVALGTNQTVRTFDQCLPAGEQGNPNGAWTFNTLMLAIAGASPSNPVPAENMLLNMLDQWNHNQTINTFTVFARTNMGTLGTSGFLSNWPIDPAVANDACTLNGLASACPSLAQAPMRLEAIVNRIDLGQFSPPFPPAGELRFVFTASANAQTNSTPQPCGNVGGLAVFNMILEYNVPSSISAVSWAQQWNDLPGLNSNGNFSVAYLNGLQAITDQVVTANQCQNPGGGPNASCIAQIRTNEIMLATTPPNTGLWELREFHFSDPNGVPTLAESTIAQTPDPQFNISGQPPCTQINGTPPNGPCTPGTLSDYVNTNTTELLNTNGNLPVVPLDFPATTSAFRGGSSLNNAASFWVDASTHPFNSEFARIDFSVNTCNGCHGGETKTAFQQVFNRLPTNPSTLSDFLLGCANNSPGNPDNNCTPTNQNNPQCSLSTVNLSCTEGVPDPNDPAIITNFGDIARRVSYLQTVCGNSTCTPPQNGGALLVPFLRQPIGVH